MTPDSRHLILTGTSGTGKSTLIDYLQTLGYHTSQEPVRKILIEQGAIDGPAQPSKDPLLFLQTLLLTCQNDLELSQVSPKPSFFDRGIPDIIAYAIRFGVEPSEFKVAAKKANYNTKCFVLPPWRAIFVKDQYRGKSFEEYTEFHQLITQAYKDIGYQLIEVPFLSIEQRAEFILTKVKEWGVDSSL